MDTHREREIERSREGMRDDYSSPLWCHCAVVLFLSRGRKTTMTGHFKSSLEKRPRRPRLFVQAALTAAAEGGSNSQSSFGRRVQVAPNPFSGSPV